MSLFALWSFLTSPLGRILAVGLAVLVGITYIDRRATYRERARCNAEKIQSQLNAANADLAAARKSREEDERNLKELASEKATALQENESLKKRVSALPLAEQCIIPDGGVRGAPVRTPSKVAPK